MQSNVLIIYYSETMKAALLTGNKEPLDIREVDLPPTQEEERLVVIQAGALNHRDIWISQGMYPGIYYPCILGSDGSGICDGEEVVLLPSLDWGIHQAYQHQDFQILGLPRPGTFAQMINIPASNVFVKPNHLSRFEAAALPLAGLTAYRALFVKGELKGGQNVLISGIGGGVALFALQFALAVGAKVYVTSGSQHKIEQAIAMGAEGGVLYTEEKWSKTIQKISGGIDVIVDGAGGAGFNELVKCCNPGAIISNYGGTAGAIKMSPQILFWKQIQIKGTTMGSPMDFQNMLNFVTNHHIVPVIDSVYSLHEINAAFARMADGKQFGKIIVSLQAI